MVFDGGPNLASKESMKSITSGSCASTNGENCGRQLWNLSQDRESLCERNWLAPIVYDERGHDEVGETPEGPHTADPVRKSLDLVF